jgi:hypothetical protein
MLAEPIYKSACCTVAIHILELFTTLICYTEHLKPSNECPEAIRNITAFKNMAHEKAFLDDAGGRPW